MYDYQTEFIEYYTKDKQEFNIQIWDIGGGGHGKYSSIMKNCCRGALGAIIVCDWVKIDTLDKVQKWKEVIDENSLMPDQSPIPAILIANKSDLLNEMLSSTLVDKNTLDSVSVQNKFIHNIYTSAKTGHNINEAFEILIQAILSHDLENQIQQIGFFDDAIYCWMDDDDQNYESFYEHFDPKNSHIFNQSITLSMKKHTEGSKYGHKNNCKW